MLRLRTGWKHTSLSTNKQTNKKPNKDLLPVRLSYITVDLVPSTYVAPKLPSVFYFPYPPTLLCTSHSLGQSSITNYQVGTKNLESFNHSIDPSIGSKPKENFLSYGATGQPFLGIPTTAQQVLRSTNKRSSVLLRQAKTSYPLTALHLSVSFKTKSGKKKKRIMKFLSQAFVCLTALATSSHAFSPIRPLKVNIYMYRSICDLLFSFLCFGSFPMIRFLLTLVHVLTLVCSLLIVVIVHH